MNNAEAAEATQYLTCTLGNEVFALEISKVREVLDFPVLTKIPRMPDFMRGVINLRGTVVPVADLRSKFGMSLTEKTVNACVVILEALVDGETIMLGALADSVQEVIELTPEQIEPAPRIGTKLRTEFIKGLGKRGDQFVIILDVDRVFSTDEIQQLDQAPSGNCESLS